MIIFGSRTWSKLLATLTLVCRNCHNPAAQHVMKRSTWFTLFFIPVIPLYFRHSVTCTYCGATTKLSKGEAEQMIASAQAPQAYPTQQSAPAPQQAYPAQQSYPQQSRPAPGPGSAPDNR